MALGLPENSRPFCWIYCTPVRMRSSDPLAQPRFRAYAHVYDFKVQRENSHWMLHDGSKDVVAAYQGSVWIDPNTARVLRIEIQARDLPSDFRMDQVETAVDYSDVKIGETSVLLPVHAETLGCERGTSDCSHNTIDFRNYHEFKSETKIKVLSP